MKNVPASLINNVSANFLITALTVRVMDNLGGLSKDVSDEKKTQIAFDVFNSDKKERE